jgi:hypothetical protein
VDKPTKKQFRCAIYARKSTEHNLDLEFNSLDAQREACEAYIESGTRGLPEAHRQSQCSRVVLACGNGAAPLHRSEKVFVPPNRTTNADWGTVRV